MNTAVNLIDRLITEVREWEELEVLPHHFGGKEFRWGKIEIGYVHSNGMMDNLFNRKTRKAIIEKGLAQRHHLLGFSGWITTFLRSDEDLPRVRDLLRLSWLQKRVRRSPTMEEQIELSVMIN